MTTKGCGRARGLHGNGNYPAEGTKKYVMGKVASEIIPDGDLSRCKKHSRQDEGA